MGVIIGVFLLAGFVKGVIGLGLPTIAMGLLSTSMEPAAAASLLIIPSLITNIWQLLIGPQFMALIKRLSGFIIGVVLGTIFSFLPSLTSASGWTLPALGFVLIIYGIWGLIAKKMPSSKKHEIWLSPTVGYITGVITAATGVFVIPAVPYLQTLKLNKNELIQALGLAFTASTVALAIKLSIDQQQYDINWSLSAFALIPAIGGMYLGQYFRKIISEKLFRRCFFIGLIGLGIYMATKLAFR
ncbi:sulfite exporter TauE/SafE family protein [Providencia rettgeri]|uniref:sulfite exporter TauE/SafE family protein n=1 Tax=Providencia rettgeri TaxID=587 RepID=UPI002AB56110|nr:sulfite exporter TauE/SafE family protein [Providencia rettgeri]